MRKLLLALLLASSLAWSAPKKPKLVLAIVLDQFRYDYITRFRADYKGGFDRLLTRGAVFPDARYMHVPTVTAVGHSTFLTGAIPSISGIVANEWFDRDEGRRVTSVSDPGTELLGRAGEGSSPRRLLVDTIGDEMKMASGGRSRVIGVSLKDRAAILPAGHMADGAYWFDPQTGSFVSSTYYLPDLPGWAKEFNAARPADKFSGATWLNHKLPAAGTALYNGIEASPFGNDIVGQFAERALQAEQLGLHDATDLLAISYSAHDYVGHGYGPFSPEEREVSLSADKLLDRLFQAVDKQVGIENTLIVLTGDHGVAPIPETGAGRRLPGGRIPGNAVSAAVLAALNKRFGQESWLAAGFEMQLYLDSAAIERKNADPAEVRREAARAAAGVPHIFRVYTRDQLLNGLVADDPVGRRVLNGYNQRRGADIVYLQDPYWLFAASGTSHGTPFGYDTHVPILFLGASIRAGRYYAPVAVNDIAPTLAAILEVETPAGSVGRILSEILVE